MKGAPELEAPLPTSMVKPPSSASTPSVFPWPRTPWCRVRAYLASPHFAAAAQLTLGVFFLSLFVVVDRLRFPLSCQSAVVFAALAIQVR